jgi:spoIIIJ-associated protein
VELTPMSGNSSDLAVTVQDILEDLLSLMDIEASIVIEPGLEDEAAVSDSIVFDIQGDDLGLLIGRRGQTLASLQYIVKLIASRRTDAAVPIVVDVEGYKKRRYTSLKSLALNLAEQVKARQMPFALEPMTPYERRIIHLTLANDPDVTTQSIGEGDARKVVIVLREK